MRYMMKWAGLILVVLKVTPCTSDSAGVMWGQVRRWRLTTVKGIQVGLGHSLWLRRLDKAFVI
jgi:cell division septal protein FtsQ